MVSGKQFLTIRMNYKPSTFFLLVLFFVSVWGCKPKMLELTEWKGYINDPSNGLIQNSEWSKLQMGIKYRPTEAMVWQMLSYPEEGINQSQMDSLGKLFNDRMYFLLSINHVEGMSLLAAMDPYNQQYRDVLEELSFGMKDHTRVITDCQDTVQTYNAQFFKTYGMSQSTDVLLTFERKELAACDAFDILLFGMGLNMPVQKYHFTSRSLKEIPELILN